MYPLSRPQVRFEEPPVAQQPPQPQPQVEAQPISPEIPLVTTKLPPPVDTRDPGPARPSQPTFSEAAKEKEVVPPSNVPTYESLLSAVSSSKEGFSNLGPISGPTA
jgi:hypothetical protein